MSYNLSEENMVKAEVKKEESEVKNEKEESLYFYAVGRRKTAIAQVKIYPVAKPEKGIMVNGKKSEDYFPVSRLRESVKSPLALAGQEAKFDVETKVTGGGISAQAEAIRLGVARALVKFNEELRKSLKDKGYLTRDPRVVERKKPGFKKARRSPQWAKR